MIRTKWVTAAMTASLPLLLAAEACADTGRLDRQIPAQDLEKALMCFSSARGVRLSYQPLQVKGLTTHGANGNLTAQEELGALLAGTGLTFRITGENTVTLVAAGSAQSSALTPPSAKTADGGGAGDSEPDPQRLAQAGQGSNTSAAAAGGARLDEVVVTAQKRAENPVTVPVPVTALQASDLENYNELRLQDYFSKVPGLQFSPNEDVGTPQIAIRGIIAGQD